MVWYWNPEEAGKTVYTQKDLDTFTHILYLNIPADTIAKYRRQDAGTRDRPSLSVSDLNQWQEAEKKQLSQLCRKHRILFSVVSPRPTILHRVSDLLHHFQTQSEEQSLSLARMKLDDALATYRGKLKTVVVLDGDRTLAAEDTGKLFWKIVSKSEQLRSKEDPLKELFNSSMQYSYTAFCQATLLYEDAVDDQEFECVCHDVALAVQMHSDFVSLLQEVARHEHVQAVVITCGLRRVWEKVLEIQGLSKTVKVIGGGRISDGLVVTAAVKTALVTRLKEVYRVYVWVFGDSLLDLGMMGKADRAIVVVGDQRARSHRMDAELSNALDKHGLRACQVVLPANAPPRLDTTILPLIQLGQQELHAIMRHDSHHVGVEVIDATNRNATKLLTTPTRDAKVTGPALRKAHRRIGRYLVTEFLTEMIGLEEYQITHVLGIPTSGFQLLHEKQTTIVALMRGGEPMASGVSEALPLAVFVHASRPEDLKAHHIDGQLTVLLVDSVVNTGNSVIEFVQRVLNLSPTIRVVIIASVVQSQSVSENSQIQALRHRTNISLVALRLSDTKYTGSRETDTGNRLFNTTHLP